MFGLQEVLRSTFKGQLVYEIEIYIRKCVFTPGSRNKSATPRSRRAAQPRKSRDRGKKTPAKAKVAVDKTPRAPPVQVFEEETRMSADIKPPIPPSE